MPAPALRLTELPIEILEKILLHLPDQDIIKMESISRHFWDLARSSPTLKYRRELFAAGLIDNPHNPCEVEEGRKLCKEYAHKWSDATIIAKSLREVSLDHPLSDWDDATVLGRNLLAIRSDQSDKINFAYIPPALSQRPTEQWDIPKFPFEVARYTTYPPKNVLAVAEKQEGYTRKVHLLNLLDGSPYCFPHSNIIVWTLPPGVDAIIQDFAITDSRLMIHAYFSEPSRMDHGQEWRLVLWNWETGDLVFDRSSADGSGFIRWCSQTAFLDEFRIMVGPWNNLQEVPEFIVFNTFFPQEHPRNVRRFKLPPKCHGRSVLAYLDRGRSQGGVNRDGPLIVDPAQTILVIELWPTPTEKHALIILRIQPLVERAGSIRTEVEIPWDEWGRGATIMDVPINNHNSSTIVHGARMLMIHYTGHDQNEHHRIHIFDFSRRGSPSLPVLGGSDGGIERKAVFEDGRSCLFKDGDGMSSWGLQSLGDSLVFYIGILTTHSDNLLRILDLI